MVVIPPFSPTPSPFPCTPIMYLLPVAFCLPTLYLFSLSYVIVIILWLITSPLSQASSNHHSSLNFYKINFFIFRTWVGSCSICFSVPDVFHLFNSTRLICMVASERILFFLWLNSIPCCGVCVRHFLYLLIL